MSAEATFPVRPSNEPLPAAFARLLQGEHAPLADAVTVALEQAALKTGSAAAFLAVLEHDTISDLFCWRAGRASAERTVPADAPDVVDASLAAARTCQPLVDAGRLVVPSLDEHGTRLVAGVMGRDRAYADADLWLLTLVVAHLSRHPGVGGTGATLAREAQLLQTQKLESIGQLAAGIAHEINTPIQFVGDNLHFLKDAYHSLEALLMACREMDPVAGAPPRPSRCVEARRKAGQLDLDYLQAEIPSAIEQSLEGVDRVAKIVRAMKAFSHPDTGERTPVDINAALESTIAVARHEWKYVADLRTEFARNLPHVPCFAGELNQALLNILINAAQAIGEVVGERGPDKGLITVSTRLDGDAVEVRIADTGPGIPESIRRQVFNPFFTTKPVGKGTGQGLAIAHAVVVGKHHGSLTFESAPGEGTRFVIRLPLDPA
jgi:signal transduction histidine kinase